MLTSMKSGPAVTLHGATHAVDASAAQGPENSRQRVN
jgi:hypothetical protein